MKQKSFLCLIFLLQTFSLLRAQAFQNILISDVFDPNEISICISPADTNKIVAGANLNNVYYSTDGGLTWQRNMLYSSYGVFGDPCVIADTAGTFYYSHLAQNDTITVWPRWADRVICQTSTDAGISWSNGTFTGLNHPHMQDKEWAAVDPATNYIAVCWTEFDEYASTSFNDSSRIFFSISKDGAQTWSAPQVISAMEGDCLDEDNTVEGAMPAFGTNGEIFVVWAFRDSLYFIKSMDTGHTWMNREIAIASQPVGWDYSINGLNRCNGLPVTIVDHSGSANRGTIYVNWTDKRNGPNDADVFLMKSIDGGNSWTAPYRVNDDAAGKENFMSWMTIDKTNGNVYVVFYDRRNYNDIGTDVYLAYSTNGGNSFTNEKISATPFYPNPAIFFGDYIGVSALNGCVRPAWMRLDNSNTSVWTAIVNKPDLATGTNNILREEEFEMASPNPTTADCIIHHNEISAFKISVADVSGRVVFEKIFMDETAFIHFADLKISKGIYFLNCSSTANSKIFKIVFAK